MDPKAELAEFVMDHVTRGASSLTPYLGAACTGITSIAVAFDDAQERRGNWGGMLANLRAGVANLGGAIPTLRIEGGPGLAAFVAFAERQVRFANLMIDEIIRLQAGESTGA